MCYLRGKRVGARGCMDSVVEQEPLAPAGSRIGIFSAIFSCYCTELFHVKKLINLKLYTRKSLDDITFVQNFNPETLGEWMFWKIYL
jgi:hypothetical protein